MFLSRPLIVQKIINILLKNVSPRMFVEALLARDGPEKLREYLAEAKKLSEENKNLTAIAGPIPESLLEETKDIREVFSTLVALKGKEKMRELLLEALRRESEGQ